MQGLPFMTPSQQAKAAGLKSLAVVADMTGQSIQTLGNWAKNKPELFAVVLAGCKALQDSEATGGMTDRQLLESIARVVGVAAMKGEDDG